MRKVVLTCDACKKDNNLNHNLTIYYVDYKVFNIIKMMDYNKRINHLCENCYKEKYKNLVLTTPRKNTIEEYEAEKILWLPIYFNFNVEKVLGSKEFSEEESSAKYKEVNNEQNK